MREKQKQTCKWRIEEDLWFIRYQDVRIALSQNYRGTHIWNSNVLMTSVKCVFLLSSVSFY